MPSLVLNIDVNDKGTVKVKTFSDTVSRTRGPMDRFTGGTRQMESGLGRLGSATQRTLAALRPLTSLLGGLSLALTGGQIIRASDAFSLFNSRVGLVTDSLQEQQAVMKRLGEIAQGTRQSFEATATVYTRIAQGRNELGRTADELLRFTEQLNKLVVVSGASATEAKAALIQLSQGLASNRLSGDELRSVLEQMPAVARLIAESLAVPFGKIRELAEEGKITADVVIDAVLDAEKRTNAAFDSMATTAGQAFQRIKNAALFEIGERFNVKPIVAGLNAIADNMGALLDAVGKLIIAVKALIALKVAGWLIAGAAAARAYTASIIAAAVATRGFTLANLQLGVAIIANSGYWKAFGAVLKTAGVAAIIYGTAEAVLYLRRHTEFTAQLWAKLWFGMLKVVDTVATTIANIIDNMVTGIKIAFYAAINEIISISNSIQTQLNKVLPQSMQAPTLAFEPVNTLELSLENRRRVEGRNARSQDFQFNLEQQKQEMIAAAFDKVTESTARATTEAERLAGANKRIEQTVDPLIEKYDKYVESLREQNQIARLIFDGRSRDAEILKAQIAIGGQLNASQREVIGALIDEADRIKELTEARDEMIANRKRETEEIEKARQSVRDYVASLDQELAVLRLISQGRAEEAEILKALQSSGARPGGDEAARIAEQVRERAMLNAGIERTNSLEADAASFRQSILSDEARRLEQMNRANELLVAGRLEQSEYDRVLKKINEDASQGTELAKQLGFEFSSAFEEAIIGGQGLREVIQGLIQDIAKLVLRQTVTEPLAGSVTKLIAGSLGAFAGGGATLTPGSFTLNRHGNAFNFGHDGASLIPFARGGILESAVAFPMAGGRAGVAGEAGPEAIIPLARTPSGDLGVRSAGSAPPVTVNIINESGEKLEERERRQSAGPNGEQLIEIVIGRAIKDVNAGGPLSRSISNSFGLSRSPVKV